MGLASQFRRFCIQLFSPESIFQDAVLEQDFKTVRSMFEQADPEQQKTFLTHRDSPRAISTFDLAVRNGNGHIIQTLLQTDVPADIFISRTTFEYAQHGDSDVTRILLLAFDDQTRFHAMCKEAWDCFQYDDNADHTSAIFTAILENRNNRNDPLAKLGSFVHDIIGNMPILSADIDPLPRASMTLQYRKGLQTVLHALDFVAEDNRDDMDVMAPALRALIVDVLDKADKLGIEEIYGPKNIPFSPGILAHALLQQQDSEIRSTQPRPNGGIEYGV
jgi:hypothetical protein